ncbi:unnamed protein product, partial [Rotaria sp. Silwood1]
MPTSSGFFLDQSSLHRLDLDLFNNENEMDVLQSMEYNLEPHLTFSYSPSHGTNNLFFNEDQNNNSVNDQDPSFIGSSSRTFAELTNVPLYHVQTLSLSSNATLENSVSLSAFTLPPVRSSTTSATNDSSDFKAQTSAKVAKA